MKVRIRAALVSLIAALALFGGAGATHVTQTFAQDATPTATPVTTGNVDIVGLSPAVCLLLAGSRGMGLGAFSCEQFDSTPASVLAVADFAGDGDGVVEPDDFSSMDLDGNQIHQMDDYTGSGSSDSGSLWIMVWVPNQATVTFRTNVGVFVPAGSPSSPGGPHPTTDDVGQVWVCDNQKGAGHFALLEDEDCGPGFGDGDGVVIARLRARYASDIADIGPGTVKVHQAITDNGTIAFNVVGEPRSLAFTTLETTIQNGVTDPAEQCKLPGTAAGFLAANSNPLQAIVLARAYDIEGNAITGAVVNWSVDDEDMAIMATGLTPTLDLGGFGFGAPNIICGTDNPGTVTVTAEGSVQVVVGTTKVPKFDPFALDSIKKVTFEVVGEAASITAAAVPAAIACDGTQTSTITATVLDAAGTPVTSGNEVKFDVQVLGTANPIIGKTSGEGVATSTITPLAIGATGLPVTVSIGDLATSVRIDCTTGSPAPPPPGGTGTTPPGGGGQGVITGPDTGMGVGASVAGTGISVWAYALLALGAVTLSAGSALAAGRTKNR